MACASLKDGGTPNAGVVKLVDARDSKSRGLRLMRVRFPPPAPFNSTCYTHCRSCLFQQFLPLCPKLCPQRAVGRTQRNAWRHTGASPLGRRGRRRIARNDSVVRGARAQGLRDHHDRATFSCGDPSLDQQPPVPAEEDGRRPLRLIVFSRRTTSPRCADGCRLTGGPGPQYLRGRPAGASPSDQRTSRRRRAGQLTSRSGGMHEDGVQ